MFFEFAWARVLPDLFVQTQAHQQIELEPCPQKDLGGKIPS